MSKRTPLWSGAWLVLGMYLLLVSAQAHSRAALPEFTDLVEQNRPAVVNISTTQKVSRGAPPFMEQLPEGSPFRDFFRDFFGEEHPGPGESEEFETQSLGSGFITSSDGYILTNAHVVEDATEIIVRLSDRRQFEAEVVGKDELTDVAVLKIDATDLPVANIGDSDDVRVGEWVLAIGSPFGFDHSVTAGIVSAKGRTLPGDAYVPFIQTDVAINPGNSGGPLFNMEGEVVGVNAQIFSQTGGFMGLSFSTPINVAMDVVEQLRTHGEVARGWLGVFIQDVTRDLAESFDMDHPRGALVSRIQSGSPAVDSDLQVGDIIVEFEGSEVVDSGALPHMVGRTPPDNEVEMTVIREGEERTVTVRIGKRPTQEELRAEAPRIGEPQQAEVTDLGIRAEDLTEQEREELDIEEGVRVTGVEAGPARSAEIRRGDIILMLNNEPVASLEALREIVAELPRDRNVPVLIQRDGDAVFMALRVPE